MKRFPVMLAVVALCAACASDTVVPATEILVVVNSDLQLGSELTSLQVSVQTADGSGTVAAPFPIALTPSADAGMSTFTLPLSFGITKPKDGTESLRVVVAGYGPLGMGGSETKVIEQKAITSFQDRRTLRLSVFLGSICLQNSCDTSLVADPVCYPSQQGAIHAGECGPVRIAAGEPVAPKQELGGVPGSRSPADSGTEGGSNFGPGGLEGGTVVVPNSAKDAGDTLPGAEGDAGRPPCGDGTKEDTDGDGFTGANGDCDDCLKTTNPAAVDVPGNGKDEDCNGSDDPALVSCDQKLALDSSDAKDGARAIEFCQLTEASSPRWGVLSARFTDATGKGMQSDPRAVGVLLSFGAVQPRAGASVFALSSGVARAPGQADYTKGCDSFGPGCGALAHTMTSSWRSLIRRLPPRSMATSCSTRTKTRSA